MSSITTFNSMGYIISQKESAETSGVLKTIETLNEYDTGGNVIKQIKQDGTINWFEYDTMDRLIKVIYDKDNNGEPIHFSEFGYDGLGRQTSSYDYKKIISYGNQTLSAPEVIENNISYVYNAKNQMTEFIQNGIPVSFGYNTSGNLSLIKYKNSETIDQSKQNSGSSDYEILYEYNDRLQLQYVKVKFDNTTYLVSENSYDNDTGRLISEKKYRDFTGNPSDHILLSYSYNSLGMPEQIVYTDSSAQNLMKESFSYIYDNRGYITNEVNVNNYAETPYTITKNYDYDPVGRLISADSSAQKGSVTENKSSVYTYDNAGNRLSAAETKDSETFVTTYSYNNLNQLLSSQKSKAAKC